MKKINILDSETSNKIAAGEVVERPCSVVKELLENSIDAKSSNIVIEIEDGGKKSIKIIDDGAGIYAEDIKKAFLPHATSKINSIDDIYHVSTMGFRGEALASIAAVSKVKMKSKTADEDIGKEICIIGGSIENVIDTGCNTGTSIEVEDLFFNVPARLKFLKSTQSETSAITDIINRLAIANPDISIKYTSNGRSVLKTYGTGNVQDVIRSIYGKNICDNLINFENHTDKASLYGYIGNSEIARGSRNNQSIFVNNRYIKNKLITAAVENAFKSFVTINKFPFFILFIDIYPELIDVNVHPTKSEVKFSDDRELFRLTFDSIHEVLKEYMKKSFNSFLETKDSISESYEEPHAQTQMIINETPLSTSEKFTVNMEKNDVNAGEEQSVNLPLDLKNETADYKKNEMVNNNLYQPKFPKLPNLRIIGSVFKTYILAEGPEGLYIIDQHAAHEKILFEKLKKSIAEQQVLSQLLVTPTVIELSSEDFACFTENMPVFKSAGFTIEIFGSNTISIREVPLILGKPDMVPLFMGILDNLKNLGSGKTPEVKYDVLAKMACKSAVKAHDFLNENEMKALIEELKYIDEPFNCPHGRPTIIKITLNEFEKKFKRIQ